MQIQALPPVAAAPIGTRAAELARAANGHLDAVLQQLQPPGVPGDPAFVVDLDTAKAAMLDAMDALHAALALDIQGHVGHLDLHLARDEVHDAWALLAITQLQGPGAATRVATHVEVAMERLQTAATKLGPPDAA